MNNSGFSSEKNLCCFCGKKYECFGHNPEPLASAPLRCCNYCNTHVVYARFRDAVISDPQQDDEWLMDGWSRNESGDSAENGE